VRINPLRVGKITRQAYGGSCDFVIFAEDFEAACHYYGIWQRFGL
jgi:hypothetical protein